MNNFTPRAQQVLALSRKEADRFHHNYVGTEHLLLGLIALGQGVAVNVLQKQGLDIETLRIEVEKQVGAGPDTRMSGSIPYTPRVKKILALAGKEAKALNHSYVGTEHILLGLLREDDGVSARVLKMLGVDLELTREEILQELDPKFGIDPNSSEAQEIDREITRIRGERALLESQKSAIEKEIASLRPVGEKENVEPHPAFRRYLAPGETLLWDAAPERKLRLGRQHLPAVLFLLPLVALILAMATSTLNQGKPDQSKPVAAQTPSVTPPPPENSGGKSSEPPPAFLIVFFGLFGLAVVGSAFMAISGGLSGLGMTSKSTLYGITSLRLIIITGTSHKTARSFLLSSLSDVRMEQWTDGLGRISFGSQVGWPYANRFEAKIPSLQNIRMPAKVLQLIAEARRTS